MLLLPVLLSLLLPAAAPQATGLWDREPLTTSGSLRGRLVQTEHGAVAQFVGVRYARAVTRFAAPVPHRVPDATAVVDADADAPPCTPPPAHAAAAAAATPKVEEDCLFVNVFAPAAPSPLGARAMLLWLLGEGEEGFSSLDPDPFDASALAAQGDIVVVTVNHRVGAFGFLYAGAGAGTGNAGLLDVLEAVRWAQANAAAFDADPRRLALGGRFTGASLALLAFLSPGNVNASAPVSRLLLQGGLPGPPYFLDAAPAAAANRSAALAAAAGCPPAPPTQMLACLRALSPERLLNLSRWQRWRPLSDGVLVAGDPLRSVRRAAIPRSAAILSGETSDEGSLCVTQHFALETAFAAQIDANNVSKKDFSRLVKEHLQDFLETDDQALVDVATHEYKAWADAGKDYRAQFVRFCGALYVRWRAEAVARALARRGAAVWRYELALRPAASPHPPFLRAAHGDDTLFAFGLERRPPPAERALAGSFRHDIGAFVRTGSPNGGGGGGGEGRQGVAWPPFLDNSRQIRFFTTSGPALRTSDSLSADVDFWGSVAPAVLRRSQGQAQAQAQGKGAKLAKPARPRPAPDCAIATALIALALVQASALLLMGFYLFYVTRGRAKGLLAQEHVPQ